MGKGMKKHQKRLSAPSHWLLDKLSGVYAPKASAGPHKSRECLPLIIFLRNRLKYALNYRETKTILQQRLIKVDHKVRTDMTYPTGFMDVISIEKTGENFRLIYDTKGRFTVHRIQNEEAEYKLGKVRRVQLGRGGIPFLVTHDARTYVFFHSSGSVPGAQEYPPYTLCNLSAVGSSFARPLYGRDETRGTCAKMGMSICNRVALQSVCSGAG